MKKPTESGRVAGTIGAGTVGGGGITAMCERRLPGATYWVVANARCRSACALRALRSLGFAGMLGAFGFRSTEWGKLASALNLKLGSTGLAKTLAIKIAARAVTMMEMANQRRRTRRQRRPWGS